MTRAARLLDLVELLRRHRRAVAGETLAAELGISLRTLYRDIAVLQGQGVPVEGAAGLGYVLRPGLTLPPLMFDEDEIDALVLGLRLVTRRLPETLGPGAAGALAKIEAVLPANRSAEAVQLFAGGAAAEEFACLGTIREAIRAEDALAIRYTDKAGVASQRAVWPIIVGFFDQAEVLAAWCEMRGDFRHFRLDRIAEAVPAGRRMGRRHRVLLADWRLMRDAERCAADMG
ncbi:YafY family protein [Aureimonas sp. Leaf324]|jgi:predicted DNA-binding transcriptional regulator YafY|uniref:helix-turn-helix transcriptional regulator n=1 Tax=Aureimonas sp. Leaf324 TaxID=1736336 RepID=UPI0006F3A163|nr:YafY family protein [Aureimonas sp. Leaf324]KQQ79503.1 DNA-binding protein [Aureimonas sp. Leaf324]